MITYLHENGAKIPIVAKAARDQLNRPEEEAGSVLSSTLSYLTIYRDPVVANNVSRSDFRIGDLMHSEEPVTPAPRDPVPNSVRSPTLDKLSFGMLACASQLIRCG